MPESIRKKEHIVHNEPGHALSGDQILIECRKITRWSSTRSSESHNYYSSVASKNAYAVLTKRFTNISR